MTTLSAADLRAMVAAAHRRVAEHKERLNALNVFPIPDADTGTNLSLTLSAAARAAADGAETEAGQALLGISRAAILGAKGNSGVILAQYLRGLARNLAGAQVADGSALAAALTAGAAAAYAAVDQPVEGTILTVARRAAEAATAAAAAGGDPATVLAAAAAEARRATAETPELLAVLKQAGVVDAAGLGLCHVLEAMAEQATSADAAPASPSEAPAAARASGDAAPAEYGFEVQFVLEGEGLSASDLRRALRPLGGSLVVVGDDALLKVHIHAPSADAVLAAARRFGEPREVTVENLDAQMLALHDAEGDVVP
jgi:DAK2 domain fusion protein YloV